MKGEGWHKYDHVEYVLGSSEAVVSKNIAIGVKAGMPRKQAIAKALAFKESYLLAIRDRIKREKHIREDDYDGLGSLWDASIGRTW